MYLIDRVFLNRRRIAFGMSLLFLACLLRFTVTGGDTMIVALSKSVVVSVAFVVVISLVIVALPGFRFVAELLGIWFLAETVLDFALIPGLSDWIHGDRGGLVFLFAGLIALQYLLYGRWWSLLPPLGRARLHSDFWTSASPERCWAALVPQSDNPGAHYSGTLHSFEPIEGSPNSFLKRSKIGPSSFVEETLKIADLVPGRSMDATYHIGTSDNDAKIHHGSWHVQLQPSGNGTDVRILEVVKATAVNNAFLYWFDDLGRQVAASMISALENKRHDPSLMGWARKKAGAA